ncbi:response regulator [Stappia indica]|uniref:hypothetical protein n=1 Tax=Stappia indica TaxID=538381 RepID=UPI001CD4E805|nr:hypothetical protein [Stappia indica]MCA1297555.1 hypothetical protein [Stappia indica]
MPLTIPHVVFLHVEADTEAARLFREALLGISSNIRVRRVMTGQAALDLIARSDRQEAGPPFDCLVTNRSLLDMSGAELAARLRKRFDPELLPVIELTEEGSAEEGLAEEGGDLPAADPLFAAVYRQTRDPRQLAQVAGEVVATWFAAARRFHC